MPALIRMSGATRTDKHICLDCRYGTTRVTAHGKEETHCRTFERTSREMVVDCNGFEANRRESPQWMLPAALYIYKSWTGRIHFMNSDQIEDDSYLTRLNEREQEAMKGDA